MSEADSAERRLWEDARRLPREFDAWWNAPRMARTAFPMTIPMPPALSPRAELWYGGWPFGFDVAPPAPDPGYLGGANLHFQHPPMPTSSSFTRHGMMHDRREFPFPGEVQEAFAATYIAEHRDAILAIFRTDGDIQFWRRRDEPGRLLQQLAAHPLFGLLDDQMRRNVTRVTHFAWHVPLLRDDSMAVPTLEEYISLALPVAWAFAWLNGYVGSVMVCCENRLIIHTIVMPLTIHGIAESAHPSAVRGLRRARMAVARQGTRHRRSADLALACAGF